MKIFFFKNDNFCTKFAIKINFRREPVNKITIKIIPNNNRPKYKK